MTVEQMRKSLFNWEWSFISPTSNREHTVINTEQWWAEHQKKYEQFHDPASRYARSSPETWDEPLEDYSAEDEEKWWAEENPANMCMPPEQLRRETEQSMGLFNEWGQPGSHWTFIGFAEIPGSKEYDLHKPRAALHALTRGWIDDPHEWPGVPSGVDYSRFIRTVDVERMCEMNRPGFSQPTCCNNAAHHSQFYCSKCMSKYDIRFPGEESE